MPQIEQVGLYQGEIKDFAVSMTNKAKVPQFVVTLLATDQYDDANEVWVNWTDYGLTITGYLVLVTLDQHGQVVKCFAYDNIMEAVNWDGETYSSLAAMDLKGKRVQFRVQEDTYEGKTRFKVVSIAAEDAEIGLRKLSGKDLTNLDTKFGVVSSKPKTAAKPKKKASAPKPPKTSDRKPPKAPTKKESCTVEEAYNSCIEANAAQAEPVPGEVLDDFWTSNITQFAADVENVTNEEWIKIRDAVLADLGIPF